MTRIILFGILLSIPCSLTAANDDQPNLTKESDPKQCSPNDKDDVVVERYPDDRVKTERQVTLDENENFISHGEFRSYMQNGHLAGVGRFDMGKKVGEWTRIFSEGESKVVTQNATSEFIAPFTSTATFCDDVLHGNWTIVDGEGRPLIHWQFLNGHQHGQWTWFNVDGSTRKQITFEDGQIVGEIVASSDKKHVEVLARYIEGRELVKQSSWHSEGVQKSFEGFVLKPREITAVHVDWWDGNIETKLVGTEGDCDRHGAWQFWYANGSPQLQGTYDRGIPVGRFVWWHANGQKQMEGDYVDGRMHGNWQMWHANGTQRCVGDFAAGKRAGHWISWHNNGMRKMDATYSSDGILSEASFWNSDGRRLNFDIAELASLNSEDGTPSRK